MPESWRNILERAAANLSVELDRAEPALKQQHGGWPSPRQRSQRPNSPVKARDLLARELEAISKSPSLPRQRPAQPQQRASGHPVTVYKAPISQAVRQPSQPSRHAPDKGNPGRELAALSISVMIVVLAIYGFFLLLH